MLPPTQRLEHQHRNMLPLPESQLLSPTHVAK
jgi:hypothetical protein